MLSVATGTADLVVMRVGSVSALVSLLSLLTCPVILPEEMSRALCLRCPRKPSGLKSERIPHFWLIKVPLVLTVDPLVHLALAQKQPL